MSSAWRVITAWFTVIVLSFASATVYAGDRADGSFFMKNIIVNGEEIVNYNLQYPFFLYNDVTYLPLTADIQEIFGFTAELDSTAGTLKLRKSPSTLSNIRDNRVKNNAEDVVAEVESRFSVHIVDGEISQDLPDSQDSREADQDDIMLFEFASAPEEAARPLDLGESPVLMKGKIIYMPLRAFSGSDALGWSLCYDPYFGICVSTDESVPAQSLLPESEVNYNKGLVRYILSVNGNLSASKAQELVFMLRRAADVNDIDEKMLIAVMEKESRFNANAVSRSGAVGLMQFMPKTAAGLGLSVEQLYDPKTSIDYGAAYISRSIDNFGGDINLALSAYNQGSGNVSRGTYSRGYANRVQSAVGNIDAYLEEGGYVSPDQ